MKQNDTPSISNISTDEIPNILRDLVAKINIPEQADQIPGWYLIGMFGVGFEWAHFQQPDALGREKVRVHMIAEDQAEKLVQLAKKNLDAFDLACYLGGSHWGLIGNGDNCSATIRCFSANVLCGKVNRPKRNGRPKGTEAYVRILQYTLCRWVADNSSLRLSRNNSPSTDPKSACDLVAAAFIEKYRMQTSYSQLLDVCKKGNFKEVRDLSIRFFPAFSVSSGLTPHT